MQDPILERRLVNCKKLIKRWQEFYEYIHACMKGAQFDSTAESKFLQLKSQVAILHDGFLEAVDTKERGVAATAQSVISVVERCIMLSKVQKMDTAEIKKMEIEWHESYLLMNETIAILEEQIEQLSHVSHVTYMQRQFFTKVVPRFTRVLTSTGFYWAIGSAAALFVLIGLPMLGVFSYDALNTWGPSSKVYTAARTIVRKTVMKNLEYQTFNSYRRQWELQPGYAWIDFSVNEERAYTDRMLVKAYPNVEQYDMSADVNSALAHEARKIGAGRQTIVVKFILYPTTAGARAAHSDLEAWRSRIPMNSRAQAMEERHFVGRCNNVLILIYSDDPGDIQGVADAVQLKVKTK